MDHIVEVKEQETNVLAELQTLFPSSSKTTLRRMLQAGRVIVDGEIVHSAKCNLTIGQTLEVVSRERAPPPPAKTTAGGRKIDVVYEDDDILVLDKPAGLLTVATDKMESDTLHSRAQSHVRRGTKRAWAHIVHRLDRKTSGLLVFGRYEEAKINLQTQFAERSAERIYHAIVEGRLEGEGTERCHLFEDQNHRVFKSKPEKEGSREAITHWKALSHSSKYTLVQVRIETGRRHQIRVQMSELGHPILGDKEHGSSGNPINRLCLHASRLKFKHPKTGEEVQCQSAIPSSFNRLVPISIE